MSGALAPALDAPRYGPVHSETIHGMYWRIMKGTQPLHEKIGDLCLYHAPILWFMCPPPFVTRRLATHPLAAGFCYYAGGFSVTALSIAAGSTLFSPFTSVGSPIFNKEDIPAASIRRAQIFKTLVQDKPEASDAAYLDSLQQSHLSGLEQKLAMHPMIYSIPLVLAAAISPRFRKASKLVALISLPTQAPIMSIQLICRRRRSRSTEV